MVDMVEAGGSRFVNRWLLEQDIEKGTVKRI